MEAAIEGILSFITLALMILCVIRFYRSYKDFRDRQMENKVLHLTCRNCGNSFDGTQNSVQMGIMTKETSHTNMELKGPALVSTPTYDSYARKAFCPYCREMEWVDIQNINEVAEENRRSLAPDIIKLVVSLMVIEIIYSLLYKVVGVFF